MGTIQPQDRPRRAKDVAVQSMPPDTILLNLQTGYYFSTNPIGAAVWELCDGARTVEEIVAAIGERTDKAVEDIRDDILEYLATMRKEGLIELG